MEAMILAAGLGTRLRPLTNDRPKALVEVNGTTLLEYNLRRLIDFGFNKIEINVHHFPDMVIDSVRQRNFDAEIMFSDERELLMDTGGALKKAAPLFSGKEPVLIHNVDILSTLDLGEIYRKHLENKALATLLVSKRNTSRQLLFDKKQQLVGWHNSSNNETLWSDKPAETFDTMAFSGIHIVNPELFDLLPPVAPYPVIPEYLKLAKHHKILAFSHLAKQWIDVGKPETLKLAEKFMI